MVTIFEMIQEYCITRGIECRISIERDIIYRMIFAKKGSNLVFMKALSFDDIFLVGDEAAFKELIKELEEAVGKDWWPDGK